MNVLLQRSEMKTATSEMLDDAGMQPISTAQRIHAICDAQIKQ